MLTTTMFILQACCEIQGDHVKQNALVTTMCVTGDPGGIP